MLGLGLGFAVFNVAVTKLNYGLDWAHCFRPNLTEITPWARTG